MAFSLNTYLVLAQDVIFSNFNQQDQLYNPASSPVSFDSKESALISLRYRDQWNSIQPSAGFHSAAFLGNFKVYSGNLDHWHLGFSYLSDKSDNSVFKLDAFEANGSYTRKIFGNRGSNINSLYVSAGVSLSYNQLNNIEGLWFGRQFNDQDLTIDYSAPTGENFEVNQVNYFSLATGIRWIYFIDDQRSFESGISLFHLNNPETGFNQGSNYLNSRLNFFFSGEFPLNSDILQKAGLFVSMQKPSFQFIPSYMLKFLINNEDSTMKLGLAGRISNSINSMSLDAIIIQFGLEARQWGAQLNYDINVSSLNQFTSGQGALELSLFYKLF